MAPDETTTGPGRNADARSGYSTRALKFAMVALLALGASAATAAAQTTFVSVGTGAISALLSGGARLVRSGQSGQRAHGVRCSAEPTSGSVYNVDGLRAGELDLALVQSDVQYAGSSGSRALAGCAYPACGPSSLYPELVTVVARRASQVGEVQGPKGKRVDIGRPGSGAHATWEAIEAALGWTGRTSGLPPS